MTITLALQPQEEERLEAIADAKGISADALVREAIEGILAGAPEVTDDALSDLATGVALVAAMQASPYKDTDLEATRAPLPIRDVAF